MNHVATKRKHTAAQFLFRACNADLVYNAVYYDSTKSKHP